MKFGTVLKPLLAGREVRAVAREVGLHENTLYRVLSEKSDMTWDTAESVLDALGYQILVVPKDATTVAR